MTIKEFRETPQLVDEWVVVLAMPITQVVLRTLRENGPEFALLQLGLSPTDCAVKLGHEHGFAEHHQRIEEMGERWPLGPGNDPEPTYAAEPTEAEEQE